MDASEPDLLAAVAISNSELFVRLCRPLKNSRFL